MEINNALPPSLSLSPPLVWQTPQSAPPRWNPHVMLCKNPYVDRSQAFGCGQCMPCRINRKRIWSERMQFEADTHTFTSYITLTYRDVDLPPGGTLEPSHLTLWLKRIRAAVEPDRLRFYACGEYGDENWRPHYHAILFGYRPCHWGTTRKNRVRCCESCDRVSSTWGKGSIECTSVSPATMAYVAGYVTKKLTSPHDPRLKGRKPEFARMSLKPGVGAPVIPLLAKPYDDPKWKYEDVNNYVINSRKRLPLGRYLTKKLRIAVGVNDDGKITQSSMDQISAEMLPLQEAARLDPENNTLKKQILKANAQKNLQMETRLKIHSTRKKL